MGRRKRYLEENGYICSATIQLQHHLGSSHLGTLGSEEQCLRSFGVRATRLRFL
jgi:hypothetical protein